MENVPSVVDTDFVVIDAAVGFVILLFTVAGSTPEPEVKIQAFEKLEHNNHL
jgi:hypothetical protein